MEQLQLPVFGGIHSDKDSLCTWLLLWGSLYTNHGEAHSSVFAYDRIPVPLNVYFIYLVKTLKIVFIIT